LFWALLASGQTSMRKVDGWKTLVTKPIDRVRFKVMRRMLAIRKSMGGLANGGGETQ
jgi:hypothetical protein